MTTALLAETTSGTVTVSVAVLVSVSPVVVTVDSGEGAAVVDDIFVKHDSLVCIDVEFDCAVASCTRFAGTVSIARKNSILKTNVIL